MCTRQTPINVNSEAPSSEHTSAADRCNAVPEHLRELHQQVLEQIRRDEQEAGVYLD